MPEDKATPIQEPGTGRIHGWKGSQSGKGFASAAEANENDDWQAFKLERKLSFAAQKDKYTTEFSAWRKKRAELKGRQKAVTMPDTKPSPAPSPTPVTK